MGSLDDNGIYIYDETDQVSPIHTYSNLGQASTSAALEYLHEHTLIMPVANAAERDAYASDMSSAGRPASTAAPLWVERADTGAVERNRGTGWHRMIDNRVETHEPGSTNSVWQKSNLLVKKNGWVSLRIRQKRLGSPISTTSTIISSSQMPSRFRPTDFLYVTGYVFNRRDVYSTVLLTISPAGTVSANLLRAARNNWLSVHATWPTDD